MLTRLIGRINFVIKSSRIITERCGGRLRQAAIPSHDEIIKGQLLRVSLADRTRHGFRLYVDYRPLLTLTVIYGDAKLLRPDCSFIGRIGRRSSLGKHDLRVEMSRRIVSIVVPSLRLHRDGGYGGTRCTEPGKPLPERERSVRFRSKHFLRVPARIIARQRKVVQPVAGIVGSPMPRETFAENCETLSAKEILSAKEFVSYSPG